MGWKISIARPKIVCKCSSDGRRIINKRKKEEFLNWITNIRDVLLWKLRSSLECCELKFSTMCVSSFFPSTFFWITIFCSKYGNHVWRLEPHFLFAVAKKNRKEKSKRIEWIWNIFIVIWRCNTKSISKETFFHQINCKNSCLCTWKLNAKLQKSGWNFFLCHLRKESFVKSHVEFYVFFFHILSIISLSLPVNGNRILITPSLFRHTSFKPSHGNAILHIESIFEVVIYDFPFALNVCLFTIQRAVREGMFMVLYCLFLFRHISTVEKEFSHQCGQHCSKFS